MMYYHLPWHTQIIMNVVYAIVDVVSPRLSGVCQHRPGHGRDGAFVGQQSARHASPCFAKTSLPIDIHNIMPDVTVLLPLAVAFSISGLIVHAQSFSPLAEAFVLLTTTLPLSCN
jgi:hypothetical protein